MATEAAVYRVRESGIEGTRAEKSGHLDGPESGPGVKKERRVLTNVTDTGTDLETGCGIANSMEESWCETF